MEKAKEMWNGLSKQKKIFTVAVAAIIIFVIIKGIF